MPESAKANLPLLTFTSWVKGTSPFVPKFDESSKGTILFGEKFVPKKSLYDT